ncbi:MAG: phenylalanine--tRNA ligase subunit beta [Candidatus Pacebacteria bacterium]|nr:phenylalanine--tRNA ligase subunit beta [Candidatus Paceibacterota bacterium]
MLVSRNWLQSYFEDELPNAEEIAETLMLHSFELEAIEYRDNDVIIDIDVLPNRAHDCLSYRGIAREYAALTGKEYIKERYHYHGSIQYSDSSKHAHINNPDQCSRYMTRVINNVEVTDSPSWLKERLESIGQKTINNIVDATNYVMFDYGNPMHAFDADKVSGDIQVRNAKQGEKMITLSGEEIELQEEDLVIADEEKILALAGIKGSQAAEVTQETKNIILEVANFNPTTTRITSRRVKILTDSSKRFENEISSELSPKAMEAVSRLISDIMSTESLGVVVDVYPNKEEEHRVNVEHIHICSLLGIDLEPLEVENIFTKLDYQYTTKDGIYDVAIPFDRLDLLAPEDLIEEIGRIYGYHNIPIKHLDEYSFTPAVHTETYIENTLKNFLTERGFSEIKTYSFVKKGHRYVKNALANDKSALRKNLYQGVLGALENNTKNIDYFGLERICVFEIGRVYTKDSEENICCIAISNKDKKANKKYGTERAALESCIHELYDYFGVEFDVHYEQNSVSFNLADVNIGPKAEYGDIFSRASYGTNAVFHEFSAYPYVTRDISFWHHGSLDKSELSVLIKDSSSDLLQKVFCFDTFEKDGDVSYGFSLVFQSSARTLTDEEVLIEMKKIEKVLDDNDSTIR